MVSTHLINKSQDEVDEGVHVVVEEGQEGLPGGFVDIQAKLDHPPTFSGRNSVLFHSYGGLAMILMLVVG